MTELSFAPQPESGRWKALLVSAVILCCVAAAVYFLLISTKEATVTVPKLQVFAPHTEFSAMHGAAGTHVIGTAPEMEDDLYVVATIHFQNHMRVPIFIMSTTATLTAADGTQMAGTVVLPGSLPRVEEIFPQLKPMLTNPLPDQAEVTPKGAVEGSILLMFPNIGEPVWKGRKSATLTLNLAHQQPQTVTLP